MTRVRLQRLFALLVLPLLGGPAAFSRAQPPALPDPLPLQRIVIPVERVPAELQRQGLLVQMPRAEFEAKVRQAAQAQESLKRQPRLIKAVYSAEFVGSALTGGNGQWSVYHPGGGPGILRISQLNLALDKIKLGNADAILGDLDGKNWGLWIDQPGAQTQAVYFDWSLRGQPQSSGIAFDLRVPACPQSILEIKTPADCALLLNPGVGMVEGPMDAERADRKLWRIQTTGRTQIGFTVRQLPAPTSPPLVFATIDARQQLLAGAMQADFNVQIDAVQAALSELIFDHDAVLQPYEVVVRQGDMKDWQILPAAPKSNQAALSVRLREPRQGMLQVRIRCLAARATDQAWTSPGLRLRRAIPRGETLQIVVPADQPVERWEPGQFRLMRTGVETNGDQALNLVDLDPEASAPRRPRLTLAPTAILADVRQQSRLSVAPTGLTLASEITYTARRGQAFQLAVQLPPGPWRVDEVDWEPKDALRSWTSAGEKLFVELQRPLAPRIPSKLKLRLQLPIKRDAAGERQAPIPEVLPLDAVERQATYDLYADPDMRVALVKTTVSPMLAETAMTGQEVPPWFSFSYRDQPLVGLLRLREARTAISAHVEQQATLASTAAGCEARVVVEPIAGQPDHVDLLFSTALAQPWTVLAQPGAPTAQIERRLGVETSAAFLMLGTCPGFGRLVASATAPRGQTWRLRWSEPLKQRTTFVLRGPLQPLLVAEHDDRAPKSLDNPAARPWEIPVITLPEVESSDGEIVVQAPDGDIVRELGHALERPGPAGPQRRTIYRWHGWPAAPSLAIWTAPRSAPSGLRPLFDHALLTTYVDASAKCLHHFRFQAIRWSKSDLPIRLPAPARQVLAVQLDGRWLDRLNQDADADGAAVRLPMPLDGKAHWFDVWFAAEVHATACPFTFETTALEPELPAAPSRRRQVWRLAAGFLPLHQERTVALDQGMASAAARMRRIWQCTDRLVDTIVPDLLDDWHETQRHAVNSAEAGLRRAGTLGEALQRFVFDGLQEQMPLLVDQAAFRDAGLDPQTSLAAIRTAAAGKSFWDALGLVYVPTRAAPLLTSRRRWLDWQQGEALPERLHEAVTEAAAHGRDSLGQFCRADVWLRSEPANRQERNGAAPAVADWIGQHWTEWELAPNQVIANSLIVVDAQAVRATGLGVAAVLLFAFGVTRRRLSSANWLRLCILLLMTVLGAAMSLPMTLAEMTFWPAVVLVVRLALEYPRYLASARAKMSRSAPSTQRRPAVTASSVGLLAVLLTGWFVQAQSDRHAVTTVYFAELGPGRTVALVHPELLKRLDELRQRATQPMDGAMLVAAQYHGKAQIDASELQAQFDLYAISEKAVLQVPLVGIDLKAGAFLDGAPVFPTAAPGNSGYRVPVHGKGWHRLTLDFTVRHQATGDARELRCGIPALPRSQIVWQAPSAWVNVAAVRAAGETRVTLDPSKLWQELRSQYGGDSQLLLRWQTTSAKANVAEPLVREHYYWNFQPSASSLLAVLAYEPAAGNRTRLEVALPDALEVSGVDVVGAKAGPTLSKWQTVDGNPRRLAVDLAAPLSSPIQLRLQLVPRGSFLLDNFSLRLPTPLGAKSVEGVLAYRLEDRLITDTTKNLSVTGLAPEKFKNAWAATGMREPVEPTRAYSFSRAGAGARLDLTLRPVKPQLQLEWDWRVIPSGAELRLQSAWSSPSELALIELPLPAGHKVRGVDGANVHHWNAQDQLLQVWLEKPSATALITIHGRTAQPLQDRRFALPQLQIPNAQVTATTIAVRAGTGWTIAPKRLLHLSPLGNAAEQRYQAVQPGYEGVFALTAATAEPSFHGLVAAEPYGGAVQLSAALFGWLNHGDFPTLKVHLRGWPASTPRLELSTPAVRQEHQHNGADHVWTLQFPPDSARVVTIKIHGIVAAGATFELPHLAIEGGKLVDQRAAWPAGAVIARQTQGLKEVKSTEWDFRLKSMGILSPRSSLSVWLIDQPEWRCTLSAPTSASARSGQILFAQQQALPAGAGRWLHQMDWLLLARDLRELRLSLPDGAQILEAQVNNQSAEVRAVGKDSAEIPLPTPGGVFHVRALWRYAEESEESMCPKLASPMLPDLDAAEVYGIVHAPSGTAVSGRTAGIADRESALLTALAQAATKVLALGGKVETPEAHAASVAAWRQQFQQTIRHLEYQALLQRDEGARATVAELRKQLQEALRAEAAAPFPAPDKTALPWSVARPDHGTPMYWQGVPPAIRLERAAAAAPAPWWSRDSLVLLAVGVFLLSWLPHGLGWLVRLWPEQLAGLAALGYACWGLSAVAILLLAVAALGRLFSILVLLVRLSSTGPATPAPSTAHSADAS